MPPQAVARTATAWWGWPSCASPRSPPSGCARFQGDGHRNVGRGPQFDSGRHLVPLEARPLFPWEEAEAGEWGVFGPFARPSPAPAINEMKGWHAPVGELLHQSSEFGALPGANFPVALARMNGVGEWFERLDGRSKAGPGSAWEPGVPDAAGNGGIACSCWSNVTSLMGMTFSLNSLGVT